MMAPFVRLTAQTWKVLGGWALIVLGLAAIFTTVNESWGDLSTDAFLLVVVGANLLNVLAFLGMIALIRCPRCRFRLFWHAISTKDHRHGLPWFFTFTKCPGCGFEPSQPTTGDDLGGR